MNYWFIWEIAVNIIEISFIYYLYSKRLGVIEKKKKWAIVGALLLLAFVSFFNYVDLQMTWNIGLGIEIYIPRLLFLVSNILYAILIFDGSISKKIIWGILPTFVSIAADEITQLIASLVLKLDLDTATQLGTERFPLTISYLLVCAVIYLLLANIHLSPKEKRSDSHLPNYLKLVLFALLLLGIISIDQLINISFVIANNPQYELNNQVVFVNIAFLVILLSIFVFIEYIGKLTQKNLNYALECQQKSLEAQHYSDLENTMETIKDVRHDMKHNIEIIQGLFRDKKYAELDEYLNKLSTTVSDKFNIVLTPNPTINALLSSKLYIAKAGKIDFQYRINNLSVLPKQHMDVCSMLGNLLDNAIDACKYISDENEKTIDLLIENRKRMLHIRVENTYDGKYERVGNQFITRKTEAGHGRGIKSVQRIAKANDGHVTIDPQQYKFVVSVLLPLE